jgi:hypothetical protein
MIASLYLSLSQLGTGLAIARLKRIVNIDIRIVNTLQSKELV